MMKYLALIACVSFMLVSCGNTEDIPPLPGNATALRLPPVDVPHGPATNGLTLALWTEKPEYELNSRMNMWIILSNTNKAASGRIIPYDPAIHKDDYLIITDQDGKQTQIKGEHPCDGPVGLGFQGGISAWLHEKIRRPGAYGLLWRIGTMESNKIEIKVVPPQPEAKKKAQPEAGGYRR